MDLEQPSISAKVSSTTCCLIQSLYICCCCCFRRSRPRYESPRTPPSPEEYALLERPESRLYAQNNLLSVPILRGPSSLSDRSSYASSMGVPPSTAGSGSTSIQGPEGMPKRFKKMRKKSASDLSVFIGILRHGSALGWSEYEAAKMNAARSSSVGNLRTTFVKHARRGRYYRRNNLQRRLQNISPHNIQDQIKLGRL